MFVKWKIMKPMKNYDVYSTIYFKKSIFYFISAHFHCFYQEIYNDFFLFSSRYYNKLVQSCTKVSWQKFISCSNLYVVVCLTLIYDIWRIFPLLHIRQLTFKLRSRRSPLVPTVKRIIFISSDWAEILCRHARVVLAK